VEKKRLAEQEKLKEQRRIRKEREKVLEQKKKLLEKKKLVEERRLREQQKIKEKKQEKIDKLKKLSDSEKEKKNLLKLEAQEKQKETEKLLTAKKELVKKRKEREDFVRKQKELEKKQKFDEILKQNQIKEKLESNKRLKNKKEVAEKIKEKRDLIKTKNKENKKKSDELLVSKKKEQLLNELADDFTQVTVLNKSDLLEKTDNKIKGVSEKNREAINDNIENKVFEQKIIRERKEAINKRKFSYFKDNSNSEKDNKVDAKDFFDEKFDKDLNKKLIGKDLKNDESKKKLKKRSENLSNNGINKKKSELHTALNNSSAILELKEQKKNFSREVLYFDNLVEQLGLKQKKQLKEFSNAIKDKQIRIVITTSIKKKSTDYKKYKRISKSRSLYIRAFLINQGISHNRIIIEINEEKVTNQWKNEVILKFIEV
jgi:trichohyalin